MTEPNRCHYYIDEVVFTDDPHLTPAARKHHENPRGGRGIVTPTRANGTWNARRDIVLGAAIDDYARCGKR